MTRLGTLHPLYRTPKHSEPCPHCRHAAGTETLVTADARFFLCEQCSHRWHVARHQEHQKRDAAFAADVASGFSRKDEDQSAAKPAACPSCGSNAMGTLAKLITAASMWRCQACGHAWTGTGEVRAERSFRRAT